MKRINISRHARRRLKLYGIPETEILNALTDFDEFGKHTIIKAIDGIKNPVKIVIDVRTDDITVITAYPLKRGRT